MFETGLNVFMSPLKTTFEVLTNTDNAAAVHVLVNALDSRHPEIQRQAFHAILARRNPAGHREILNRLHTLDPEWLDILQDYRGRMTAALRGALLDGDRRMCENGCRAVVLFREYDLVPILTNALTDSTNPHAEMLGRALIELAEALYDELAHPRATKDRRDPQIVRNHVVDSMERAVQRFGEHRRQIIVEAFLLLVKRDNVTLKKILQDPHHPAFVTVVDLLSKSLRPGIIRLLLSFLNDPYAPPVALSLLGKRYDLRFVRHLLQKVTREPTPFTASNLKRIGTIGWLRGGGLVLDQLDEELQRGAVQLVMQSGVPRLQIFGVLEYLLRHGKPDGRRAAAEALTDFNGAQANALTLEALADEDPQVQAIAVTQLRRRGIPGALTRLVELVDSPHDVVRQAARQTLEEFSFLRFVGAFDMLDDDVRRSTGLLVKRIDPETIPLLKDEMKSPIRTRRLRAIAICRAIDAERQLENALTGLLRGDPDHVVRVEAAEALATCQAPSSRQALKSALEDTSLAVREAARKSLGYRERPWTGDDLLSPREPFHDSRE